jgi:hypothetical protein
MLNSDVFISYRRKDTEFVRQLSDALKQKQLEVWVDWEDIAPGSKDFTDDIRKGIEGANSFIAVLSPDYLTSEYCINELNYAVQNHKYLLPIVYRAFEDTSAPPSISHINWIYFCEHAGNLHPFDESLTKLFGALTTDQDFIRMHTQLLVRAREWESRGKAEGFLLSGEALMDAETFLNKSVSKEPKPSQLHADYVLASHQAEQKQLAYQHKLERQARSRMRLLVLLLGIMLVLGASTLAGFYAFVRNTTFETAKSNLTTTLKILATGIDVDELTQLVNHWERDGSESRADPLYFKSLLWLKSVHEADPRMYPYIYVQDKDGKIGYIADVYTTLDSSASEPTLQGATPEDLKTYQIKGLDSPTIELSSYQDRTGDWLSGFAPIKNRRGTVIAGIAVNMQMAEVFQPLNEIGSAGFNIGIFFAISFVVGAVIFVVVRYENSQ